MDQKTLERIKLIHPKLRNELKLIHEEIDLALTGRAICRSAYTVRTFAEQDGLYAIGRTVKGQGVSDKLPMGRIVTHAKGGESYHNYALAEDIVLLKDTDGNGTFETASYETNVDFDGDGKSDWQEVVFIFKKYGWDAGIDWKFRDAPHFQKTFGYSIMDLKKMFNEKKFIPNTNYLLI